MSIMNKKLLLALPALLFILFNQPAFAIELQSAPEAEKMATIDATNNSDVYGSWLFNGGFQSAEFTGINPGYRISQGDTLMVQLWGGINVQQELIVDAQGNIFVPEVGPVKVLGVENQRLNEVVLKSINRVYKSNVEAYVTLASSQKIKVFLSGLVENPGLYEGQSADSVLRFIDQAGGIKKDLGSYRNIQVKRAGKVIRDIDLYEYLSAGTMTDLQMQDGDVIFIGRRNGEVSVEGEVSFSGRYELKTGTTYLNEVVGAMVRNEKATHVTVVQPEGQQIDARQYALSETGDVVVRPGALIKLSSQLRQKSISVELIGEHDSPGEIILPWGASLKDLLDQIEYTSLSNASAIQLYRKSVAVRQKETLDASLTALEQSVLTARSGTVETAQLRKTEAEIVLKWIEKAREVQPRGQVLLSQDYDPSAILLQQDDKIVIPPRRNLVMIHGEVWFPTAISYEKGQSVKGYVAQAGGATEDLGKMNVLLMKPNGSFVSANGELKDKRFVDPGDEIFVLAKPDFKSLQVTKDITQVIYQIAVSAAVVLAL